MATRRLGYAPKPTSYPATVPSSVGGMNSVSSLMAMAPDECLYTYNLMPVEYGLELRKGYKEWATGVPGAVRTILPYESNVAGAVNDRLWAVSNEGIYDITLFGETAPNEDVAFTITDLDSPSGWGVSVEFTNDQGGHYLFYADGANGIHQYSDETSLWSVPTGWTWDPPGGGVDQPFPVADIAFVMLHKLRIWVVLEDQDDGWFLPVGSITGKLERFIFGAKMPRGGRLMGLWNWTVDGGEGVDDYLVAIGRGGDVVLYRGSDPTLADTTGGQPWEQAGSWYVGDMTSSRRVVVEYGSAFYILSAFGLTDLVDLLGGTAAISQEPSPSRKITRFLRRDVYQGLSENGWSLQLNPNDGFLQIISPEPSNTPYLQYNQNLTTTAWGLWEGVPALCADTWNGEYYMGTAGGVVHLYDGAYDNTLLDGTLGEAIAFRTLTSFQVYGKAHGTFKRCGFIRTVGVTSGTVTFNVQAVYDYQIDPLLQPPGNTVGIGGSGGLWNSATFTDGAIWNQDIWAAGLSASSLPTGALGMGRALAIAMNGSAEARINIVAWDVTMTEGGNLL